MAARHIAALTALALGLAGVGACGGSSSERVLVHVGDIPITTAVLAHWETILAGGNAGADSGDRSLRERTLRFLISAHWLIGEALAQGLAMTKQEVRRQVDRTAHAALPGMADQLREFLKATRQSLSDAELQAGSELAQKKLRRLVNERAGEPTQAQIAAYYARHKQRFLLPERREARFTSRLFKAAAEKIKREVQAGKSLTSPAQRRVGEIFTGTSRKAGERNAYERAIFASTPYRVSGPFHIGPDYFLYQVTKVIPARIQTLAQVEGQIRGQLLDEMRRRSLAAFVGAWRSGWLAKTDCAPGYVVQQCKQYRGPVAENALELG